MGTETPAGVVALDVHACWELLRSVQVGRLAVLTDGRPDIFPINFVVDHGTVVFRTSDGTKLAAMMSAPDVAFEADAYDTGGRGAWSVVLRGQVQEITQLSDALDAMRLPLSPHYPGPKNRYLRVVPDAVTGRRFQVVDAAVWRTSMTDARTASPE